MLRLYSYALSPFAAKVHCYLCYKGLEFETFYVNPLRVREELPLGHQIPVLEIDGEYKNDSTPIGLWLEQRFPQRPKLLPEDQRDQARVLAIDRWVTDSLIPVVMRMMLAIGEPLRVRVRNRSRGARVLNATVPVGIPLPLRLVYPFVIARVGFLQRMVAVTDLSRPNVEVFAAAIDELVEHIAAGLFLGGLNSPSLADCSAYAQLALPYLAGYDGVDAFTRNRAVFDWFVRVGAVLEGTTALLPPGLSERVLPR